MWREGYAYAVVEDVNGKLADFERVEESLDREGKALERVLVLALRWNFGEAKAG